MITYNLPLSASRRFSAASVAFALIVFATFTSSLTQAQQPPATVQPLIAVSELQSLQGQIEEGEVILLDIRVNAASIPNEQQRKAYQQVSGIKQLQFLEYSLHLPYQVWRSLDKSNPGKLISTSDIQSNIERLGYEPGKRVVIVHHGHDATDFGSAARVYWTLKSAGIEAVSILDGGYLQAVKAGYPVVAEAEYADPSDFDVNFNQQWLTSLEEIKIAAEARDNNKALLLDARTPEQFKGEQKHPVATRYGSIPQSQLLTSFDWFDDSGKRLQPKAQLQQIAARHNLLNKHQVVHSFCNTGHWAATNWFVLSELLGQKNTKLYPGSFIEYAHDASNPVINEPNRLVQLWRSLIQ